MSSAANPRSYASVAGAVGVWAPRHASWKAKSVSLMAFISRGSTTLGPLAQGPEPTLCSLAHPPRFTLLLHGSPPTPEKKAKQNKTKHILPQLAVMLCPKAPLPPAPRFPVQIILHNAKGGCSGCRGSVPKHSVLRSKAESSAQTPRTAQRSEETYRQLLHLAYILLLLLLGVQAALPVLSIRCCSDFGTSRAHLSPSARNHAAMPQQQRSEPSRRAHWRKR